ncbi:hypothetical protein DWB84_12105 [Saccharophagus sp. K07]|uniref:DUF6502 family protein n=1 Tax=Saccharophagus sp. K07 TaxID=2283636 RepID=UPI001651F774|nr:DUF6502 family protein [Saccharophagus sp. K07]MBC6906205.1 hypothetical protein [Saccharophagus sp. K07]
MADNLKAHVIATVKSLMKPIIMLLLRNGVTYKEFAVLCKSIFVEAAAQDYGIRGRPTNVSRIAVLTGIDRKEVKRIKDLLQENVLALEAQSSQDRITRILTAWHRDPEFSDDEHQARPLPIEGEHGSFQSLVRRFGGDVPRQALFKEMLRVGVIAKQDDRVTPLSRYYFPAQSDPQALLRAGSVISELGETLFHNLYVVDDSKPTSKYRRRFERRASNNQVDSRYVKAFHAFLEAEGQAFLERVDAWLSEHEVAEPPTGEVVPEKRANATTSVRLGVGVFAIEKSDRDTGN